MPKMRLYCSMSQNFLTFNIKYQNETIMWCVNTPHNSLFLIFDTLNVKYLVFDIPYKNAPKSIPTLIFLPHFLSNKQ